MSLIDAHCHMANLVQMMDPIPLMEEAANAGIRGFVSSILTNAEAAWHRQNKLPSLLWQAGVHPSFDESDLKPDDIDSYADSGDICAIGEIGVDRGNPDLDRQVKLLNLQAALAVDYRLPVCLHIVGRQDIAYTNLKQYLLKYMVHGYAGSLEGFELLSRLDCVFTISSRILREDKRDLLEAMLASGRYLFETDITRYYVKDGETNPLLRLIELFETVKQISGKTETELIETQNRSLEHWLGTSW